MFKNPVCKVYRFQTVDSKWMLVREQMGESTLSFTIPKQLITLHIQEDSRRYGHPDERERDREGEVGRGKETMR